MLRAPYAGRAAVVLSPPCAVARVDLSTHAERRWMPHVVASWWPEQRCQARVLSSSKNLGGGSGRLPAIDKPHADQQRCQHDEEGQELHPHWPFGVSHERMDRATSNAIFAQQPGAIPELIP